jgi:hypothetical protein
MKDNKLFTKTGAPATPAATMANKGRDVIGRSTEDKTLQLNADLDPKAKPPVHAGTTAVATLDELKDMGFDPNENMDGVEPRLPQIGIAHQAQIFKMPNESKVDHLVGVIIDSNRANAWWKQSFAEAGSGNPPDCFAFDAVTPAGDKPQAPNCAACRYNRYGSENGQNGEGGRGKACKNMRRVHILLDGKALPYRLTLPPTSLRAYDKYMMTLAEKQRPYPTVITQIELATATNKGGIEYSEAAFTMLEEINDRAKLMEIKALRLKLQETMRSQEIVAGEASGEVSVDSDAGTEPDQTRPGDKF